MAGSGYDIEVVFNWLAGGGKGNVPNNKSGKKEISDKTEIARNALLTFTYDFALKSWEEEEDFPKAMKTIWNLRVPDIGYFAADGAWAEKEFEISNDETPIIYQILPADTTFADRWNLMDDAEKAKILFWWLFEKETNGANKTKQRYIHASENLLFAGNDFGYLAKKYNIRNAPKVSSELRERINNIVLSLDNSPDFSIYDKDISNIAEGLENTSINLSLLDLVANTKYKTGADAVLEVKSKIKLDNLKRTSLSLKESIESLGEGGDAKANSLFKNLEQCFLLSSVSHFAKTRSKLRKAALDKSKIPYGGRVIPIDCTPVSNFINYSSTTGDIYTYSQVINARNINDVNYNFQVLNVAEINVGTVEKPVYKEIEMPLLFGNITNEGKFEKAVLYNESGTSNITSKDQLLEVLGAQSGFRSNISYTSLDISFIGENQATAKTNVDVSLTLQMPNLTYLQAEFSNMAEYYDDDGALKKVKYKYSPLDLITYLHRTSLRATDSAGPASINVKKYQGCARLYNPKFLKSYQRLIMKIIPTVKANSKILGYEEYLQNSCLILDLALIDHTITRGVTATDKSLKDEIKIDYKGFIRSKIQDPIFDCLRSKKQLDKLVKKEKDLIEILHNLNMTEPKDKQTALVEIKKAKIPESIKNQKSTFKQTLFSLVKKRTWRVKYNPQNFLDYNLTKDFKILDSSLIYDNFSEKVPERLMSRDVDVVTIQKDFDGSNLNLDFIYFGDLVDILMNNMYKGELKRVVNRVGEFEYSDDYEKMEDDFKDFPLKIILPSFFPIEFDITSDIFRVADKKINMADFPIAISWLDKWIDKNILEADVSFYSIGPLMSAIVSNLINGMLLEDCYLNGSSEFLQFGIKSEFGLFAGNKDIETSLKYKAANKTELNVMLLDRSNKNENGVLTLNKDDAPFFFKNPKRKMSEYCNFLVMYQQMSVLNNYKTLNSGAKRLIELGVPYFNLHSKALSGGPSTLVKSITYSKATANYQRESRFELENLYSLSQLASVYNVTVETNTFLLDVFPGMLSFVNAGLYQDSSVVGSIANTLGMGGFHLNEKVTHKATITGDKMEKPTTTITANWIYSGAVDGYSTETADEAEATPAAPGETVLPDAAAEEATPDAPGETVLPDAAETPPPPEETVLSDAAAEELLWYYDTSRDVPGRISATATSPEGLVYFRANGAWYTFKQVSGMTNVELDNTQLRSSEIIYLTDDNESEEYKVYYAIIKELK